MNKTYNTDQHAEMAGSQIGWEVSERIFAATSQAEALMALCDGLGSAFNPDRNETVRALAAGFAVSLINLLERGRDAVHADSPSYNGDEDE